MINNVRLPTGITNIKIQIEREKKATDWCVNAPLRCLKIQLVNPTHGIFLLRLAYSCTRNRRKK